MTASAEFLTGRRVTMDGRTFLVVGKSPRSCGYPLVACQDVETNKIHDFPSEDLELEQYG